MDEELLYTIAKQMVIVCLKSKVNLHSPFLKINVYKKPEMAFYFALFSHLFYNRCLK